MESYSRVLDSLASNLVGHIYDVLYVDGLTKHYDLISSLPKVSVISHKSIYVPYSILGKSLLLNKSDLARY